MNKFKFLLLLVLSIFVVSCSKDDDSDVDSFFKINGIKAQDFPLWSGDACGEDQTYEYKYYYYSAFKANTDDYYIWICDGSQKIIAQTVLTFPKQITEDQGYGNVVTCERGDYSWSIRHIGQFKDFELFCFTPEYTNLQKKFTYLLSLKGRNIYVGKTDKKIHYDMTAKEWYKNSILLGRGYSDNCFCVSENGELISSFSSGRRIFNEDTYTIPFSYTEYIIFSCLNTSSTTYGILIEKGSLDNNEDLTFWTPPPFDSQQDFIVNSAKLLESDDSYYLIECQLTAYSGEKKTIKIKITLSNKKATIVE